MLLAQGLGFTILCTLTLSTRADNALGMRPKPGTGARSRAVSRMLRIGAAAPSARSIVSPGQPEAMTNGEREERGAEGNESKERR